MYRCVDKIDQWTPHGRLPPLRIHANVTFQRVYRNVFVCKAREVHGNTTYRYLSRILRKGNNLQ